MWNADCGLRISECGWTAGWDVLLEVVEFLCLFVCFLSYSYFNLFFLSQAAVSRFVLFCFVFVFNLVSQAIW